MILHLAQKYQISVPVCAVHSERLCLGSPLGAFSSPLIYVLSLQIPSSSLDSGMAQSFTNFKGRQSVSRPSQSLLYGCHSKASQLEPFHP